MPIDPRTPVIVGAASATQRTDDPAQALEPALLMVEAAKRAGDDATAPHMLGTLDLVIVGKGMWTYPDPGRIVAEALGASGAQTALAEIGILQTSFFARAARAVMDGADAVLVVGGEAYYRAKVAQRLGVDAPTLEQAGAVPDQHWVPAAEIVHPLEVERHLALPVRAYASMESRWRAERGLSIEQHRRDLAELWHRFAAVAAENPDAWDRSGHTEADLVDPITNPPIAAPYSKRHTSQWYVDQAAAFLVVSYERARALRIAPQRMVFPHAITESNLMVPVVARDAPHECAAFGLAGAEALRLCGLDGASQIDHIELYSCFPIAVRAQIDELGLAPDVIPTVSGGMAFAGGPLNNFVLQALVRLVELLRAQPGSLGMATAVSGMLTKQGVSIWSSEPPPAGFAFADVTQAARNATQTREVDGSATGSASVAAYTVAYGREVASHGIAICDTEDGRRTIAVTEDPAVIADMESSEWCGRTVRVEHPGVLSV